MRIPVELRRAYRLINHGPTTLVTAAADDKVNIMAAAWVMPVDFDPARVAAIIAKDTFTRELVDRSGELVLNVPVRAQAEMVHAVGTESGRDVDKLAARGIITEPASRVAAPLVSGCAAWLECRVLPEPEIAAKYDLFVCDVLAAWADGELFDGRGWSFDDDARRTIHHVAGGGFFMTGAKVPT